MRLLLLLSLVACIAFAAAQTPGPKGQKGEPGQDGAAGAPGAPGVCSGTCDGGTVSYCKCHCCKLFTESCRILALKLKF